MKTHYKVFCGRYGSAACTSWEATKREARHLLRVSRIWCLRRDGSFGRPDTDVSTLVYRYPPPAWDTGELADGEIFTCEE